MKSFTTPLFAVFCLFILAKSEKTSLEDHTERMCSSAFAEVDRLFSELISVIRNPNDTRYQANIDALYNCCFEEDFIYVLNGRVVSGRDNITAAIQQQVSIYSFRWTHPPVPHIYPNGSFDKNHGIVLAKLTSIIIHTFTNSTGTYTQFGNHSFYCRGDEDENSYLMVNATLANFATIKS